MNFWEFLAILIGILFLYKILELISYTVCWVKSDKETRIKLATTLEKSTNNIIKTSKGKK